MTDRPGKVGCAWPAQLAAWLPHVSQDVCASASCFAQPASARSMPVAPSPLANRNMQVR
jgi:hypothetical protein